MNKLTSKFATAERSTTEEIKTENSLVINNKFIQELLNGIPNIVLLLNRNRQTIYANKQLIKLLNLTCIEDALGKRPGEILNCAFSTLETGGCGTSEYCSNCGAIKTILKTLETKELSEEECQITSLGKNEENHLELKVTSSPIIIDNNLFVLLSISDISNKKRREALERTFFHDILNEASVLLGYLDNARDGIIPANLETIMDLHRISKRMISFIESQRDLVAAELGRLEIHLETFNICEYLNFIIDEIKTTGFAANKNLIIECKESSSKITSDKIILNRILTNLIKNACEASLKDQSITIKFELKNNNYLFSVHNNTFIKLGDQLQLFHRSFSTKGKGRGIGSYSVKLFTEQYLKGKVYFNSSHEEGTTFYIELPSQILIEN